MKRVYILLFLLSCIVFPGSVLAQSTTGDISIETIPINPEPGSPVLLTAKSYSVDLNQSLITWSYNGTRIASGRGTTTVTVVAPAAGASGVIGLTASANNLETLSTGIVLRPASVDLLWEAVDAYTPPFYKGKALLPVNGLVRFTTIPSATAPKSLSYTWSRNSAALPDDSGFGKSSLLFKHNEFNPQERIDVSVSSGTFSGNASGRITPLRNPSLLSYQNKEGFVDYANGYTDTIPFKESGIVLHFEPYYFSLGITLAELNFDLRIDGTSVTPSKPNEVGLSRPAGAGGSKVALSVTPFAYSLQHAEKVFTLLFN